MEIGHLNEVKAILKSLIISCTDKMTVEKLNREYRDIEGEFIPFKSLGYDTLERFLHSMPDTLNVVGSGYAAYVYFVANDKSIHIHDMIMEQKKPRRTGAIPKGAAQRRGGGGSGRPIIRYERRNNNFQAARLPVRPAGQTFSQFLAPKRNLMIKTPTVSNVPTTSTYQMMETHGAQNVHQQPVPLSRDPKAQPKPHDVGRSTKEHMYISETTKTHAAQKQPVTVSCPPKPQPKQPVPVSCPPNPQPKQPVPVSCDPKPQPKQPVPVSCPPKPQPKQPVPVSCDPKPQFKQPVTVSCDPKPQPKQPVPVSCDPKPQPKQPVPVSCDPKPQFKQPVTVSCDPRPQPKQPDSDSIVNIKAPGFKKNRITSQPTTNNLETPPLKTLNGSIFEKEIKELGSLLAKTCRVTFNEAVEIEMIPKTESSSKLNKKGSLQERRDSSDSLGRKSCSSNGLFGNVSGSMTRPVHNHNETEDSDNDNITNDLDDAIPAFAADNQVFSLDFPKDAVSYGVKIPSWKLPDNIVIGSCIPIFISEIHSPFKFWFHIYQAEHELDLLMCAIENFYAEMEPNELAMPVACLAPGQLCAASFKGVWHRAEVLAKPICNQVKVFFVDYGTVSHVKISQIKYLAKCFATLPAQALRGCLSHVKPLGCHWSRESIMYFLSMVEELLLYAKIVEIDKENMTFYMVLCDTHKEKVVQVNKSLIQNRFALFNEDWRESKRNQKKGQRNHHPREDFPTHSMIETGEYPNFSELLDLYEHGIDYEIIYDRIIFNKFAILNFHENVPESIRKLPFFLQTTNPFRTDILFELTGLKATL